MEAIERITFDQDWITLLLIVVLLILVVVKTQFPQRFLDFSLLFATNKYLLLRGREPQLNHPFNLLLFAVNVFSISLFFFLFYRTYSGAVDRPQILFLQIATAYTTFILLKFSIEKIFANIVSLDEEMNHYLFYKLTYRNFLALLLLPVSLFFTYAFTPGIQAFVVAAGIVLLLNLVVIASIFRKNQQIIVGSWFYFILYLCALEIGPYFILYKLLTKG